MIDWKLVGTMYLTAIVTFIIYFVNILRAGWMFDKEGNPSYFMVVVSIVIFIGLFIIATLQVSSGIKKNIQRQREKSTEESLSIERHEEILKAIETIHARLQPKESSSPESIAALAKRTYEIARSNNANFLIKNEYACNSNSQTIIDNS